MPTRPNPDSPFMPARVESALGINAPGGPSMAGKPGVQAGDLSFPAPPSVQSAPPGRPASTQPPAPSIPARPRQQAQGPAQPAQPAQGQPAASPAPQPGVAPAAAPVANAPLVTPSAGTFGEPSLSYTPEGAQRYRELAVRVRDELGPLPRIFRHPDLPELPVEVGQWNFNPFTGRWIR